MNRTQLQFFKRYHELHSQALRILFLFEDAPSAELLLIAERLGADVTIFLEETGIGWKESGNLGRHLSFLVRNLKRDDKGACSGDIKDIIHFDLPNLFQNILSLPEDNLYIDPIIKSSIFPLLDGGHYDSAIRKVFLLLTDRIRKKFDIQEQLDGEDLINRVFGGKSTIISNIDDTKRQALRNLLAGFYGVFRNNFAHNLIDPKQSEVKAVLEMANAILIEIESIELREKSFQVTTPHSGEE